MHVHWKRNISQILCLHYFQTSMSVRSWCGMNTTSLLLRRALTVRSESVTVKMNLHEGGNGFANHSIPFIYKIRKDRVRNFLYTKDIVAVAMYYCGISVASVFEFVFVFWYCKDIAPECHMCTFILPNLTESYVHCTSNVELEKSPIVTTFCTSIWKLWKALQCSDF